MIRDPVAAALAVALTFALPATHAAREVPAEAWLDDARVLLDTRLRHEYVDHADFAADARALTLRARLGLETGRAYGLQALIEGDITRALGVDDFHSTVNARTDHPVVADPGSQRLNRAQLAWQAPKDALKTRVVVGRQRIKLDDDRFVGNVGFRQNEQTYDAVRLTTSPGSNVEVDYAYLWRVNRIFGSRSPAGREKSDSHVLRGSWQGPFGTLSAHALWLDLEGSLAAGSNRTWGARLTGARAIDGPWRLRWGAAWSRQTDHGANPDGFTLDYWRLDGAVGWNHLELTVTQEVLEGDGQRGFTTPLATLHAFQGFADVFLTTPADGIRDRQVGLEGRWQGRRLFGDVRALVRYHDFESERGGVDLGRELNLGLYTAPHESIRIALQFADFSGADTLPDVHKVWLTLEFTL